MKQPPKKNKRLHSRWKKWREGKLAQLLQDPVYEKLFYQAMISDANQYKENYGRIQIK